MNDGQLLDLIEKEIEAHQTKDFRLSVERNSIQRDGNWRYVVVKPDRTDIRASRYSEIMRTVEDIIEDETDENVLLVPALVD